MTTDVELDEKLARLGAAVAARGEGTRRQLAEMGWLEEAEMARQAFTGKLAYIGPDSGFPHGQTYNFDLRGHAHVAAELIRGRTEGASYRPVNEPYRGRKNAGKRKFVRTSKPDPRRDPPATWHDVYADR